MLEGRLNEFGLPDVFQLLGFTRKTGLLRITNPDAEGQVHFQEGAVSFAVADSRRPQLATRLARYVPLSEEQHARVTEAVRRGEASELCHQLAAEGIVDAATLQDVLREHIQDVVFTLMRLDEGSFSFDSSAAEQTAVVTLPGDELVAEGARRLVEWQRIHQRVPAPSAVLTMASDPPGDDPITLQPEQWRLLALLQSARTAADLTERTGQGEYATCQILADLVEAGLVEVGEPRQPTEVAEVAQTPGYAQPAPAAPAPQPVPAPEPEPLPSFDPFDLALGDDAEPEPQPEAEVQPEPETLPVVDDHPAPDPLPEVDDQPDFEPAPEPAPEPVVAPAPPARPEVAVSDPARERLVALRQRMQEAGLSSAAPLVSVPVPAAADEEDPADEPAVPPLSAVPYVANSGPDRVANSGVDRASVARELASLGLDDDPPPPPVRAPEPKPNGNAPHKRLARDEEVSKGLLLRLIDGVKGA